MPVDPPPILPDIEKDLRDYLLSPERLPIHQYERNQQFWPREPNPRELFHFEGSPLSTTLKVRRDPDTGQITEFHEAPLPDAGANPMNSTSLHRAPAPPTEATRGNALYIPFWPGSFPDPVSQLPDKNVLLSTEFLTIPPGFKKGLNFAKDGVTVVHDSVGTTGTVPESEINLLDLLHDITSDWEIPKTKCDETTEDTKTSVESEISPEEKEVLPNESPVLKISTLAASGLNKGTEWAILLDTAKPVKDFHKQIPEMVHKFDFELDTFQKLAILHLEKHDHVFVAAHTSAGKTVVAEYAIALSQKHKTKTIYTSPIKALSNQKYRDFKRAFKDVGLITGDFQINPKASCLIMTTEILRSMLYCGSEIARDLEYVIFDEVHYINDRERGHVWEQVLILLPAHVCVVLLSATVPNTIEFADWLGRTHQKKVYVITTYKRPVPLKHYLYTGTNGKTRDNRFLVLDVDTWKTDGYRQATLSVQPSNPYKQQYRQQKMKPYNPKQEITIWSELVDHLKRNDLLPVVVFTFSRVKCDQNSEELRNLDLTSRKEKDQIRMFYEKCVGSLKESDRHIPQIIMMREILTRGIGVHHSGVLPIIKEIVEMLFQKGLIKLLFATETFAMGVNMPARTVVFDALQKHDGQEKRLLKPAEYIQMAGRAGRRGLDKEGTVIIMCKRGVPSDQDLQKVMLGRPSQLQSQFRLTYGMVLSLLRVESITVEGMMSKSFREAHHQKNMGDIEKELEQVKKDLEELCSRELSNYLMPLVDYFEVARSYLQIRKECMDKVMCSPKVVKVLIPGRVLLISHKNHMNKLGLLLERVKNGTYHVLILTETGPETDQGMHDDSFYKMVALSKDKVFCSVSTPGHQVLTVPSSDIFEISSKIIKVDTVLVLKDWQQRQIDRFRDNPPGQSCSIAIQELHKISILANNDTSSNKLEYMHFICDLKVNEKDLYDDVRRMYVFKDRLIDHLPATQIPNFEQQFLTVFSRKFLERRREDLEFEMSSASMALYPDYEKRIELLRQMKYITNENKVQLKGRVACEMGMNELLITELVVSNIVRNLQPAEVAALLSSLVFRLKLRKEDAEAIDDSLSQNLKDAIATMKKVHMDIANKELKLGISTDEFQEDLNFGLVKVVYEWASKKPFADIMCLTTIQEGIIVRCIQQLNEMICDVRDAARIIGDPELQKKMEEASDAIKRDIVFAASLYTQGEAFIL